MLFNIGDLVTRKSYNNDIIFEIQKIEDKIAYLKGKDIRLYADSYLEDLVISTYDDKNSDTESLTRMKEKLSLDRSEYFYLPGKILHLDGDNEYLERCMNFYKKLNIMAQGIKIKEMDMSYEIQNYLNKYKPNILVITGHDAMYNRNDKTTYKNSDNFIKTIKSARIYEENQERLIIIAGACQSNYEELIKSGANFASSPKRVNIHALDPAIIASSIALSDRSKPIDLLDIIDRTKYKEEGIGGIITNGTMYKGYPR
jgi:spore coat assembly protein